MRFGGAENFGGVVLGCGRCWLECSDTSRFAGYFNYREQHSRWNSRNLKRVRFILEVLVVVFSLFVLVYSLYNEISIYANCRLSQAVVDQGGVLFWRLCLLIRVNWLSSCRTPRNQKLHAISIILPGKRTSSASSILLTMTAQSSYLHTAMGTLKELTMILEW